MRTINVAIVAVMLWAVTVMPAMAEQQPQETGMMEILPELIIRPVGVLSSAFGLGLFLFTSPISALATIAEPHDALETTFHAFVVSPYRYTFRRSLGDYSLPIDLDLHTTD